MFLKVRLRPRPPDQAERRRQSYCEAYPSARLIGPQGLASKSGLKCTEYSGDDAKDKEVLGTGVIAQEMQAEYFKGFVNKVRVSSAGVETRSQSVRQDIAFLHKPSKTLIEADLLFNLPPKEQARRTNPRSQRRETDLRERSTRRARSLRPISSASSSRSTRKRLSTKGSSTRWVRKTRREYPRLTSTPSLISMRGISAMAKSASVVDGWDFDRIIPCHGDVIEQGGKAAWRSAYDYYFRASAPPPCRRPELKAGGRGHQGRQAERSAVELRPDTTAVWAVIFSLGCPFGSKNNAAPLFSPPDRMRAVHAPHSAVDPSGPKTSVRARAVGRTTERGLANTSPPERAAQRRFRRPRMLTKSSEASRLSTFPAARDAAPHATKPRRRHARRCKRGPSPWIWHCLRSHAPRGHRHQDAPLKTPSSSYPVLPFPADSSSRRRMAGGGGPPAGPVTFKAPAGTSKLPGVLMAAFAAFGGVIPIPLVFPKQDAG